MTGHDDLIEAYLDQLLARLHGRPRDVRRMLAEAEEHLRDAVSEGEAAGLDREEAARRAVARFGSADDVARRANGLHAAPMGQLLRPLALAILLGPVRQRPQHRPQLVRDEVPHGVLP